MLFILEVLQVMPSLLFNGSDLNIYTPEGIVPMNLNVGEVTRIRVPDFRTILTFKHSRGRKVSYPLTDLLDSNNIHFFPLPLAVRFNIYREIEENDVRATVIGHRGSGSEAYRKENNMSFIPENTLESFHNALKSGADWVEFDVLVTMDGEIVVNHDYQIGDKAVWNMTLKEYQQRVRFPATLEHLLSVLNPRINVLVELKYPSVDEVTSEGLGSAPDLDVYVTNTIKVVSKGRHTRRIRLASYEPEIMARLRAADEDVELFFLTEGLPDKFTDKRRNSYHDGIQFSAENNLHGIITDTDTVNLDPVKLTAAAHEAGLQLMVYWWRTLSDRSITVSEIVNLDCANVDGLVTDDIALVRAVISDLKKCEYTPDKI